MIDYNAFHNYLVECVVKYQRTHSMRGMSKLAHDYRCTGITQAQFKDFGLTNMKANEVTEEFSRWVRDKIGRSDAKQTFRETIGDLNQGILSGSRISQGSDRTVQITITQPIGTPPDANDTTNYQQKTIDGYRNLPDVFTMDDIFRCFHYDSVGSACSRLKRLQDDHLVEKIQTGENKGKYRKVSVSLRFRAGQVVVRKSNTGNTILLVEKISPDNLQWRYGMSLNEDRTDTILTTMGSESHFCPLNATELRPAKGSEVARFLGALTRSGYEWTADNANGLFFVKQKQQPKEQKPVEVFANDIPLSDYSNTAIHSLPVVSPSPFRFALGPLIPTDNGGDFMAQCYDTQMLNAVVRQVKTTFPDFDHIRELFLYDMPTLCCSEDIKEYRVALVKDDNNGTCYWLARDRDVLRLLSWVAYII